MSNKKEIKELYEQLACLRDIIILIEQAGDNVPQVMCKLAVEKSQYITCMLAQMGGEMHYKALEVPIYAAWHDTAQEHEDIEGAVDEETEEELSLVEEDKEDDSPWSVCDEDDIDVELDEEPDEEPAAYDEAAAVSQPQEVKHVASLPVEERTSVTAAEKGVATSTVITIEDVYKLSNEAEETTSVTLGDVISAHRAKELRKAFGINDRFRFRRELFANNDDDMNDTIAAIEEAGSYEKAQEMLLTSRGWDVKSVAVKEFLAIVESYFRK